MTAITFAGGTIEVDPAIVATGLRLDPETLRAMLHSGDVTSLCEKGEGEDAGRYRLTFFSPHRRLRLVVDENGTILTTTSADYRRKGTSG
jgi:hypothetical protein